MANELAWAGWVLLGQAAGDGAGAGAGNPPGSLLTQILPFAAIGILFWLLLIRPESKKKAEHGRMLENLKKNDRVVTIGGIYGTVVNVQKGAEDVVMRVDENTNTRVHVLRSAIARIIPAGGEESKESE